ncbi:C-terminal CASP domain-containing protein [Heterostelium album PN500]|uniref:C-terminal CASP domain-containing protein n=1 Tax=Heterostelium pallidum (strain ATCC 26659 / Pp 5 / PN500) TaxID=670386 RepID=D3BQF7_HETP5|nr:C-terminal CASP domain-containing protein [Heterostelium album PN500]EFA76377.1 C-terminal CASP domain-containing protein [Heterostelium album PN500]|eukprot:XP_020428509.1 C-terminal CASP domain-containing protein [Heterostelium album PN500]
MSNQSVVTPNSPGVQSPPNNGIGTPGTPGGMTGSSNNNNTSTTNNNNNSNNSDDELSSKQSEVDMLTSEIDRISTKLSTLQAENSSIREESLKEKNSIQPLVKRIAELELELLQKDSEISKLNDQLIELKQSLKDEKSTLKEVLTQLDIEREKIEKMEKHIQNNPSPADYENVKRELATLQAIVGSDEVTNSNQQNVDKLMKEKNRQLENELTKLRLTAGTYETELDESRRRVQQLESIQIEQSQLIHRLEEDITTRGGSSMLNNGGLIGNSGNVNANQPQDLESLISQSTTPSLNQSLNNLPDSTSSQSTIVVQSKDDKMLDIVVGQRDRFKVKNLELEGEKSQLEKQLETCKLETSSLKQDNIKLYEKIRFLQSYDKNRGGGIITGNPKRAENSYDLERAGGGSSGSGGGSGGGRSNNTGGETEEKYGKLYEDSINPFLSFNKKEKYRRYKEMNTAERVILNTSRFFLSNKYSRLFLFIYSILLHLLVFITLYKLAVTTAEQHADDYVPGANNQFNIDTLINNQTNFFHQQKIQLISNSHLMTALILNTNFDHNPISLSKVETTTLTGVKTSQSSILLSGLLSSVATATTATYEPIIHGSSASNVPTSSETGSSPATDSNAWSLGGKRHQSKSELPGMSLDSNATVLREVFDPDDEGCIQALQLYALSFLSPYEPSERQIARLVRSHFYRIIVMEDHNKLVVACAFIVEHHEYNTYHIDYLCVRPGMRGAGHGGKFFQQLMTYLRYEQRYPMVTLESETKMVGWYLKLKVLHLNVESDSVEQDGETLRWWLLMVPLGDVINLQEGEDTPQQLIIVNSLSVTQVTQTTLQSLVKGLKMLLKIAAHELEAQIERVIPLMI